MSTRIGSLATETHLCPDVDIYLKTCPYKRICAHLPGCPDRQMKEVMECVENGTLPDDRDKRAGAPGEDITTNSYAVSVDWFVTDDMISRDCSDEDNTFVYSQG